eukprot:s37_g7.t1
MAKARANDQQSFCSWCLTSSCRCRCDALLSPGYSLGDAATLSPHPLGWEKVGAEMPEPKNQLGGCRSAGLTWNG